MNPFDEGRVPICLPDLAVRVGRDTTHIMPSRGSHSSAAPNRCSTGDFSAPFRAALLPTPAGSHCHDMGPLELPLLVLHEEMHAAVGVSVRWRAQTLQRPPCSPC